MMRTSTPLVSRQWTVPFRRKLPVFCLVVFTSTLPQWRSLKYTAQGDKVAVTRHQQSIHHSGTTNTYTHTHAPSVSPLTLLVWCISLLLRSTSTSIKFYVCSLTGLYVVMGSDIFNIVSVSCSRQAAEHFYDQETACFLFNYSKRTTVTIMFKCVHPKLTDLQTSEKIMKLS